MKAKLLKRDFNEELENILEEKKFNKEVQNLLLSMLYKAEVAYNDYALVKREVPSKETFLENIIDIIKNYCKNIEIAKPNSELEKELENSKCKILEEEPNNKYNKEQKILVFPNEKVVLYSIIKAGIEKLNSKLNLEEKAILMAVQIGKCIAYSEVIRDFNGFSWDETVKDIESIECNAIYTDLSYLLGGAYVDNLNSKNIKKLKVELSENLYEEICKVALKFYLQYDKSKEEELKEKTKENIAKLEEMENQQSFVEKIFSKKKVLLEQIKNIDETINNPEKLREEYLKKNATLPNEKKIFSMSHYEELLQTKRKEKLKKLDEYNRLQNPIEFVKIKEELKEEIEYYKIVDNMNIDDMQKIFLKDFENKTILTKEAAKDYIYEVRYLRLLPINKKNKMGDILDFEALERRAINLGIEQELITPISNNIDTDYKLLKSIFKTRTINLEDLCIKLGVEDDKLKSEIYDNTLLDSTNFVVLPKGSNVKIRKTKKVKIF